jgi:surface antigen
MMKIVRVSYALLVAAMLACDMTGCSLNSLLPTSNNTVQAPTPPASMQADMTIANHQSIVATQELPTRADPSQSVAISPPSQYDQTGSKLVLNMDSNDKMKFSRALDKPLGKTTQWENPINHSHFIVTPTKKLSINNNSFCRQYNLTIAKGNLSKQNTGTACVGEDGAWQSVQ